MPDHQDEDDGERAPTARFCAACGTPLRGRMFCTECGTPAGLPTPAAPPTEAPDATRVRPVREPALSTPAPDSWPRRPPRPPRRRGPWLVAALAGLVLALACAAVLTIPALRSHLERRHDVVGTSAPTVAVVAEGSPTSTR